MKTSLSFFVPGQPIAQPRHMKARTGGRYIKRRRDKSPHRIHAWKELIALIAKQQEWDIVKKPDAVMMTLRFFFRRPKSCRWQIHTVKPDKDNLEKAVKDALEGIIYENDSQVFDGQIVKQYVNDFDGWNMGEGVEISIRSRKNERI